jgi:hypothetical protein
VRQKIIPDLLKINPTRRDRTREGERMKTWLNLRPSLRVKRKKAVAYPPRWVSKSQLGKEPETERKFPALLIAIETIGSKL